jgi:hypothetical protein
MQRHVALLLLKLQVGGQEQLHEVDWLIHAESAGGMDHKIVADPQ